jgi:hypothetical protein
MPPGPSLRHGRPVTSGGRIAIRESRQRRLQASWLALDERRDLERRFPMGRRSTLGGKLARCCQSRQAGIGYGLPFHPLPEPEYLSEWQRLAVPKVQGRSPTPGISDEHLRNLLGLHAQGSYWSWMSFLPQLHSTQRSPRAHLTCATPAVLRFEDGQRTSGKLQVLSLTGGLLSLSNPLVGGAKVKMMFLTQAGAVLGGAEMLPPVTNTLQPFRFTSLPIDDQRKLGTTIKASLNPRDVDQLWIEKFRVAAVQKTTQKRTFKFLAGAIALLTIGLVGAFCVLHFPLK